jgi:hypothetical protein
VREVDPADDDGVARHDRVRFFKVAEPLQELAAATLKHIEDRPAQCTHRFAPLICGVHRDLGPMCEPCANEHLLGHGIVADVVCTVCLTMDDTVLWGWVPAAEYAIMVRLCAGCRAGRRPTLTAADQNGGDMPDR